MMKKVFKSLGVVAAGSGTGAVFLYNTDEGWRRSMQFWKDVFPAYGEYRAIQFLNRDIGFMDNETADSMYLKLHQKWAEPMKELAYRMRGFYLKQAQIMSTQDDFIPAAYMKWMKDTQDNVPSEFEGDGAKQYCSRVMKEELGLNFDDVFESWDDVPLGVASIGEVHKARLRGSHEDVAVKLQLPGMEERFRADIHTMKSFCSLAMPQHVTAFDEMEKQFCTEFDYRGEADNLTLIRESVMPTWGKFVDIPKPHNEYCSKHILVMSFLTGVKLVDGVKKSYEPLAKMTGRTLQELEDERKEELKNGTLKFKSIEEESADVAKTNMLLSMQDAFCPTNIYRRLYNYSPLPWVYGGYLPYFESPKLLDLARIIEVLCRVHGYQVFSVGAFNGDCHPGNILLCDDGRLGLIDYGQVKKMTLEERINYAKLIKAHQSRDKKEVVRISFDLMNNVTKFKKPDIAYLLSAFYHDRDTNDVCHGLNIAEFMDWCEAQDPMVQMAEEYIMVGRVSILLRGMGKAFGLKLEMSKLWAKDAEMLLALHAQDDAQPSNESSLPTTTAVATK